MKRKLSRKSQNHPFPLPGPAKYKVGDKVKQKSFDGAVGIIMKPEKVTKTRTRIDIDPEIVQKYKIKLTYDTGVSCESYIAEKYLDQLTEKEYADFFKKNKIKKTAEAYNDADWRDDQDEEE